MAQAATAFRTAAQKYTFDIDEEVEAFYRDWPQLQQKVFFIDVSTSPNGSLVYGKNQDEDQIAEILGGNAHLFDVVKERYKSGIGGSVQYPAEGYDCIILKVPRAKNGLNLLGQDADPAVVDAFSFDHEIGHSISPKDRNTYNKNECVADAYAVIRHFQRFGKNSKGVSKLASMRAVEMALSGDGSHFTSPMVEQIIADAATADFANLTPAQTVKKAQQYTEQYALDPFFAKFIAGRFGDHRLTGLMSGKTETLKKFGNFVLSSTVPEEIKWGTAAFRTLLEAQVGMDGTRVILPHDGELLQLRKKLAEREGAVSRQQEKKLVIAYNMNFG